MNLQDIAKRAGVSPTTVSRALRGTYPVAQETLQRIREVMSELNYEHDSITQRFLERKPGPQRHTGNVGLVLGDVFKKLSDPFWAGVLDGVNSEVREQKYHLRFTFTREDVVDDQQQRRLLNHTNIDGLLLIGKQIYKPAAHEIAPEFIVTVEQGLSPTTSPLLIDNIDMEKWNAMKTMVDHLISLGHRRFRFITGDFDDHRTHGFLGGMVYHNIPLTSNTCISTPWTIDDAYAIVVSLLKDHGKEIDVLVCASDMIAIAALRAAATCGMRVPDDIAITGFDDMPYARDLDPPLTTIAVPKELLGRFAVRKLIERIHNPALPPIVQVIPTTLIVRRSCGAPSTKFIDE